MNLKYCVGRVRWNDRMCTLINGRYMYMLIRVIIFHKTFDVTGDKFDKQTNTYRIRLHAALQWNRNVLRRRITIVQINVVFFDYQVRKQIPRAKKGEYIIFKILYLSNIEIQKNFLDNYWLSCSLSTLPITKQHL